MKIKPLTFGQASFFYKGQKRSQSLRNRVLEYSEKQDSIFWKINKDLFCSFVEDGVPYLEALLRDEILNNDFTVYQMNIEEMTIRKRETKFNDTFGGIDKAQQAFESGKLTGKFLTKSNKINQIKISQ